MGRNSCLPGVQELVHGFESVPNPPRDRIPASPWSVRECEPGTGGLPRPVTRQSAPGGHRTVVTRCSARAAQLEPVIWTLTLAMLPPQSTQWALP